MPRGRRSRILRVERRTLASRNVLFIHPLFLSCVYSWLVSSLACATLHFSASLDLLKLCGREQSEA